MNWGRNQPMTDNTNNNQDADSVEIAADQTDSQTEQPSSIPNQPDQGSSGGGFVWLLAVLLVLAGGGYAVWPFVAPTVEPALKKARATLGFEARPTQPSLPGAVTVDRPVDRPQTAPPVIEQETPAPVLTPQPQSPEPVVVAQPEAPVLPQPDGNMAPVAETPAPALSMSPELPISMVAREVAPDVARNNIAPDIAPMVQSLTDRLDILEAQLLSASANGGVDQANAAVESNGQLVRTLSELRADLATLKTRVAALESAPRGRIDPSASAQALVLSVTQLASLVESDRPYVTALDALERIGGADPVIGATAARLRTYASSGAPTDASIAAGFKAMAVEVMKAHGQMERTGWLDEMMGAASSLVTVRQTDPARIEDPVERALAVAERALADNQLKTALAAMQSLQGAEGNAANRWREAARARDEVRDAMDVLHNHALAALAATGGA